MASAGGDWKDMYNAAERGDADCVRYHLERGVDMDYQHPEAMVSALVIACIHGHTDVVRVLLEHGANPDQPSELGDISPLQAAREGEHHAIQALLLRYGADDVQPSAKPWWARWLPSV